MLGPRGQGEDASQVKHARGALAPIAGGEYAFAKPLKCTGLSPKAVQ